jgi:mRNA interferase RelE/StbE
LAKVVWTDQSRSDLKELDGPIQERIIDKITWFSDNFDYLTPKPLSGEYQGYYKLRVGDWRIIYTLENGSTIVIRFVGHRSDIYE